MVRNANFGRFLSIGGVCASVLMHKLDGCILNRTGLIPLVKAFNKIKRKLKSFKLGSNDFKSTQIVATDFYEMLPEDLLTSVEAQCLVIHVTHHL